MARLNVGSSDPDDFSSPRLDEGHSFVNRGDAEVLSAFWDLGSGASILNQGTLLLSGEANVTGDDFGAGFGFGSLLHNTGTLRKTGVDAAALDLPVDNDGTLEVAAGTLGTGRLLNWSEDFLGDGGSLTGGAYVVRGRLQLPGPLLANAARVVLDGPASSLFYDEDFQNPDVDAIRGARPQHRRRSARGDRGPRADAHERTPERRSAPHRPGEQGRHARLSARARAPSCARASRARPSSASSRRRARPRWTAGSTRSATPRSLPPTARSSPSSPPGPSPGRSPW